MYAYSIESKITVWPRKKEICFEFFIFLFLSQDENYLFLIDQALQTFFVAVANIRLQAVYNSQLQFWSTVHAQAEITKKTVIFFN